MGSETPNAWVTLQVWPSKKQKIIVAYNIAKNSSLVLGMKVTSRFMFIMPKFWFKVVLDASRAYSLAPCSYPSQKADVLVLVVAHPPFLLPTLV